MHIDVFLYLYLQISASAKERVCVETHAHAHTGYACGHTAARTDRAGAPVGTSRRKPVGANGSNGDFAGYDVPVERACAYVCECVYVCACVRACVSLRVEVPVERACTNMFACECECECKCV